MEFYPGGGLPARGQRAGERGGPAQHAPRPHQPADAARRRGTTNHNNDSTMCQLCCANFIYRNEESINTKPCL